MHGHLLSQPAAVRDPQRSTPKRAPHSCHEYATDQPIASRYSRESATKLAGW